MNIRYNQYTNKYVSNYYLLNQNKIILNKDKLIGCTYGGNIRDIAKYLIHEKKFIRITTLKYGFAIHYVSGCGAQSIWQLNVITSKCIVSVPATDINGQCVSIGTHPNRLLFGLLDGFGASRKIEMKYLSLQESKIYYNNKQSIHSTYRPLIFCS